MEAERLRRSTRSYDLLQWAVGLQVRHRSQSASAGSGYVRV